MIERGCEQIPERPNAFEPFHPLRKTVLVPFQQCRVRVNTRKAGPRVASADFAAIELENSVTSTGAPPLLVAQ